MDQLKAAMSWLAKYHFWVLSGLAVLVGLAVWFLAVSDLEARYNSRVQKIDSDFQAMQGIQGEPQHPNERVIQASQAKHEDLKKNVLNAWRILYQLQEDKNPWPDVLGQDFLTFIKSQPPDAEIPEHLREFYQNFIIQRFPKLLELIDVRRPKPGTKAATEKAGGMEGHGGESEPKPADYTGMVFWDEGNLKGIQEPYKWTSRPSTLQVRLAQEDLWVYEALLRIIRNTNEGSRDYFKAPVRRIEAVEIGQAAAGAFSRVGTSDFSGEPAADGSGGGGAEGQPPDPNADPNAAPSDPNMPAPGGPEAGGGLDTISKNLLDRRYMDNKGKPLVAGAAHPYPEFKMMPVRLKLVMNQLQIPKLLAQCANSNMPVEVRQVRVRPDDSGRLDVASGSGAAPGGATPAGAAPGAPGPTEGGAQPSTGTASGARTDDNLHSLYVPVEVLGIIYIYNPPNQSKLQSAAEQAAASAAGAPAAAGPEAGAAPAPGATPAAAPGEPAPTPPAGGPPPEPAAPPGPAAPAPAPGGAKS